MFFELTAQPTKETTDIGFLYKNWTHPSPRSVANI